MKVSLFSVTTIFDFSSKTTYLEGMSVDSIVSRRNILEFSKPPPLVSHLSSLKLSVGISLGIGASSSQDINHPYIPQSLLYRRAVSGAL